MPSISDPFTIHELPKINLKKNDIIPISTNAAYSKNSNPSINVAISHGSLSTYQLRPTPRPTSILSVSPGTIFTALTSITKDTQTKLCYAYKERKGNHLKIIDQDTETSKSIDITNLGESSALSYSSTGEKIYVIFKNGSTGCYNVETLESGPEWLLKGKSSRTVVYSTFIHTESDNNLAKGQEELPEKIALTVSQREIGKKPSLEVKLVACDVNSGSELSIFEIPFSQNEESNEKCFSYKDGYLNRYRSSTIEVYSLSEGILIKTVSLERFSPKETSHSAIVAVDKYKVIVSDGHTVFLVDTKHGAMLSSVEVEGKSCRLIGCTEENAPTLVAFRTADNNDMSLIGFSVSKGNGSFLEALSLGVEQPLDTWKGGFCDLMIKKNAPLSDFKKTLSNEIVASRTRSEEIINQLADFKKQNKSQHFEKVVLYLQGSDWEEITDNDMIIMFHSEDNMPVFNGEEDREVSRDFIIGLTKMIFQFDKENITLNEKFVPEFTLTYLLSHPLFPTSDMKNLLECFKSYPKLLRQTITTTHSLECDQLVKCLDISDNEIFSDVISRLTSDFTIGQISEAFIRHQLSNDITIRTESSIDNIVSCIRRLMKLDMGWGIIPALIDAGGMFSWNESFLSEIAGCITEQIQSAEKSSETMCLVDEALKQFNQTLDASDLNKISKRELKKLSRKNAERRNENNRAVAKAGNSMVPTYSVEKLVIN